MKYPLLLFTLLLVFGPGTRAVAQNAPRQTDPSVLALETARLQHQRRAMLILGGWAAGNIGLGLVLRANRSGEARRFHEMNALWNAVNLGIAGLGYVSVMRTDPSALGALGSLTENHGLQKILLFNAGLDVGYLAGGFYLVERARRPDADRDRLRGYGRSIVLQGTFLLAFDLVNYWLAARRDDAYAPLLSAATEGLGLTLAF